MISPFRLFRDGGGQPVDFQDTVLDGPTRYGPSLRRLSQIGIG